MNVIASPSERTTPRLSQGLDAIFGRDEPEAAVGAEHRLHEVAQNGLVVDVEHRRLAEVGQPLTLCVPGLHRDAGAEALEPSCYRDRGFPPSRRGASARCLECVVQVLRATTRAMEPLFCQTRAVERGCRGTI